MNGAETPSTNGENGSLDDFRDRKGRFLPGNPGGPGNPQARNVGTWRKALADAVSADDLAKVTRKLVKAAKKGEPWAIREILDRCLGKPHVQIELQGDIDRQRDYSEAERIEAARLSRLALEEMAAERRALPAGPESPEALGAPESGDREQVTQGAYRGRTGGLTSDKIVVCCAAFGDTRPQTRV